MEEGPWNFWGYVVVIATYDGFSKPSTIPLDTIEIWAQITTKSGITFDENPREGSKNVVEMYFL